MPAARSRLPPPFLKRVTLRDEVPVNAQEHPFDLPLFRDPDFELAFERPVTILVGENGVGKSTLLEAIAGQCGFPMQSGTRNFPSHEPPPTLARHLRLAWLPKIGTGFFLRAESFFNLATQIDDLGVADGYGGVSLHKRSHGEAFLALFENRFANEGLYILDEPEAALSPLRQLRFLQILRKMERGGRAQVILATHSPLIMAYPGADLLIVDRHRIARGIPADTSHWRIYGEFFADPKEFLAARLDRQGELFPDEGASPNSATARR